MASMSFTRAFLPNVTCKALTTNEAPARMLCRALVTNKAPAQMLCRALVITVLLQLLLIRAMHLDLTQSGQKRNVLLMMPHAHALAIAAHIQSKFPSPSTLDLQFKRPLPMTMQVGAHKPPTCASVTVLRTAPCTHLHPCQGRGRQQLFAIIGQKLAEEACMHTDANEKNTMQQVTLTMQHTVPASFKCTPMQHTAHMWCSVSSQTKPICLKYNQTSGQTVQHYRKHWMLSTGDAIFRQSM